MKHMAAVRLCFYCSTETHVSGLQFCSSASGIASHTFLLQSTQIRTHALETLGVHPQATINLPGSRLVRDTSAPNASTLSASRFVAARTIAITAFVSRVFLVQSPWLLPSDCQRLR